MSGMACFVEWTRSHWDSTNWNRFNYFYLATYMYVCVCVVTYTPIIIFSGKTLAFLLPALIHIDGQTTPRSERSGPNVLVMAPTRELALQIEKEVGKYSYHGIKA